MGFFYLKKGNNTEYIFTIIGTVLMAMATMWYFEPVGIVTGGVTGIGIILEKIAGIPIWLVNIILNVPLFFLGGKNLGKEALKKTLAGTISLTVLLGVLPRLDVLTGDKLVDIIYGSFFMGAGLGIIFRSYSSSGGTDLLASIINKRVRYISIPKILSIVDGAIVLLGISVFGLKNGVYSLICVFIISKVSDAVVEGVNRAKLMYIISDESERIASYVINEMNRGATYVDIRGAYSKTPRNMIMCVVSAKEMAKIKQILYGIDPDAICFVGDIREAFGEGFTKFRG